MPQSWGGDLDFAYHSEQHYSQIDQAIELPAATRFIPEYAPLSGAHWPVTKYSIGNQSARRRPILARGGTDNIWRYQLAALGPPPSCA